MEFWQVRPIKELVERLELGLFLEDMAILAEPKDRPAMQTRLVMKLLKLGVVFINNEIPRNTKVETRMNYKLVKSLANKKINLIQFLYGFVG